MSKGWESKSVEEQQNEVQNASRSPKPRKTAEQIAHDSTRNSLEMSRQRVLQQLQVACNPNHRNMLEQALADLDERISHLS